MHDNSRKHPERHDEQSPRKHAESRSILIVEDDPDDRARLHRLLRSLERRRYEITDCETGQQAIDFIRNNAERIDCVLLDYYLPDMDGLEVLRTVRSPAGTSVPVSMLTGRDDDDTASRVLGAGAEDYLLKDTITPHLLARSIENVIEKFAIRRQLEQQRAAVELRNVRLESLHGELNERLSELTVATKSRDRFMAMMSHEMRTPLNAILGYAELLALEIEGNLNDVQHRNLDRIRTASSHLLDLINDVLDLSKADASSLELDLRPVNVTAVAEEVVALLENQATQKGLTLKTSLLSSNIPLVHVDLQRLRQILMNLVGNAIKFTETGDVTVRISERAQDHCVAVEVIDTGIGIEHENVPLVFNEFYQANSTLTRQYGGSGLGLAISRRLAQAMGGDITVSSEFGTGSIFTIVLPTAPVGSNVREEDTLRHNTRMAIHTASNDPVVRETVTVAAFADDDSSLERLTQQVRPSVRLVWTTVETQVATIVQAERVSLVILDISSRDGSAWRVAQTLSETVLHPAPPILLLPSMRFTPSAEPAGGISLGWVSLVPKPFTEEQLTRAVSAAAYRSDLDAPSVYDVLVIDDDEDSRRVAKKFLTQQGIRVRESVDGEHGLAEMRVRPPDVVVLDLMMPVLDGFGVLATMRADPLLSGIPAVVLTAKSLTEAERAFLARTAERVLQKGEHRLADVAALVLRAAAQARLNADS